MAVHPRRLQDPHAKSGSPSKHLMHKTKLSAEDGRDKSVPDIDADPQRVRETQINGVEPYAWMKTTLEAIAKDHPQARIDQLMPWAFDRTS
jgi:IS66 C-terminal element